MSDDATPDDIKSAYRALVHHFHPDKNPNSPFATAYFLEIQEAYEVLSIPTAKQAYDRERSLLSTPPSFKRVMTPELLLKQSEKLAADVRKITATRIDVAWLKSSLAYLASTNRIVVLMPSDLKELRQAFLHEILYSMNVLQYPFPEEITCGISVLVEKDTVEKVEWERFLSEKKKDYQFRKALPWVAVLITSLLCLLMYWYGKS